MSLIGKIKPLCQKVMTHFKQNGFFPTVKRIIRTVYFKIVFRGINKNVKRMAGMIDLSQFNSVVVFENNFGWNKIMKQRPQQIAENLPEDTLMFYHSSEDSDYTDKSRICIKKPNLVIVDLGYYREGIFEFVKGIFDKYLMVYSTDFIPYDRVKLYEEKGYKVIYEYVDDLNEELSGEMFGELYRRHEKMLADPDVYVVSTATKLKNNIETSSCRPAALITNGVDYTHFEYKDYEIPEDMKEIRENYKTLLCYYGALANWFDYDLIKKVAENKKYAIVLIGQDYDNTLKASGILDIDNVFFLGRKSYEVLPRYGCNSDICIIPFLINEITLSTSPVKLFEYMAMEKVIVTTALPECKKYESVFYSASHEEFIQNIAKAEEMIGNSDYKALEIKEAKENTWQSKAQNMMNFVRDCRYAKIESAIQNIMKECQYDRIIIWRSPFGWNVPLFQRPQHIARQFARKGCLVFYEVSPETDAVEDISLAEPNLYLVNFKNATAEYLLNKCVETSQKPVYIQIYSTNWSMDMDELNGYLAKGFKLLYEYIDDISPELAGTKKIPPNILNKYNFAMSDKSVPVVTTAKQIYADVQSKRGTENMVFACNGVDYDFFRDLSSGVEFEKSFTDIIENGKINVCYYGALASWFDYELIKKIDATDKYNIILIGIKYDGSFDASGIEGLKNVHFIGPKEYHILKYYAAKMDILTIPFVINSITQATSPLKLFEYMALHKPIVTTAMQECKNYESVMAAESHDEFIEMLDRAVKMRDDAAYMELLDKEARDNDWSNKANSIIELLRRNEQ